jgi:hypothetical protein
MTMSKEDRRTRGRITVGIFSAFSTGRFPAGASYVQRLILQMRRGLEEALAERDGDKTPVWAAAMIQSACRHEGRALLLQRKLVQEAATLTTDQFIALLRDFSQATDQRDKCLKGLRLDEALKPLEITDCPQCRRHYLECVCALAPTNAQPVAEDDASNAIPIPAVSSAAEPLDRSPEGPNSQDRPSSPPDDDAGRSSSPTPSSRPASASTAGHLVDVKPDDAAMGQGATGNGISEDDRDRRPDDDEIPF